jgi:hypothetical protein
MPTPQRNFRIRDLNTLSEYEFDREKNVARNKALFRQLFPEDPSVMLGMNGPPPKKHSTPAHASRSSPRIATGTAGSPAADPDPEGVNNPHLTALDATGAVDTARSADPQLTALDATDAVDTARSADAGQTHDSTEAPPAASGANGGGGAGQTTGAEIGSGGDGNTGTGRGDPEAQVHSAASRTGASPLSSEKHEVVLAQFRTEVETPLWASAVKAWLALEEATGFQTSGKVDSASSQRPAHPHRP